MRWIVKLTTGAAKSRKQLPKQIRQIVDQAIEDLMIEGPRPFAWDVKKTGENELRLRITYRYRMRYNVIDQELIIRVFYIGHRKDAY